MTYFYLFRRKRKQLVIYEILYHTSEQIKNDLHIATFGVLIKSTVRIFEKMFSDYYGIHAKDWQCLGMYTLHLVE